MVKFAFCILRVKAEKGKWKMENGNWEMGDAKPRSQDNGDHNGDGQRGPKHSILRVRYA